MAYCEIEKTAKQFTSNHHYARQVYEEFTSALDKNIVIKEWLEGLEVQSFKEIISLLGIDQINPIPNTGEKERIEKVLCDHANMKDLGLDKDKIPCLVNRIMNGIFDPMQRPCLAVMGLTNSGKSTLINKLLDTNSDCVPVHEICCTGRITHLFGSKIPILATLSETKELQFVQCLEKNTVPEEFVVIEDENRWNKDKVNIRLEVGLDIPLLLNGIDIIDYPGMNENHVLTDLSTLFVKNRLPILIYVIKGNDGFTEIDEKYLLCIKNNRPNLKIIYFVTHLDSEDGTDNAEKKLNNVVKKLETLNWIQTRDGEVFGAAIGENCFDEARFDDFKKCLVNVMQPFLEHTITDIGRMMTMSLHSVISKILGNVNEKKEIEIMQDEEEEVFNSLKDKLKKQQPELIASIKELIGSFPVEKLCRNFNFAGDQDDCFADHICSSFSTEILNLLDKIIKPFCDKTDKYLQLEIERIIHKKKEINSFKILLHERLKHVYLEHSRSISAKNRLFSQFHFILNNCRSKLTKEDKDKRKTMWKQISKAFEDEAFPVIISYFSARHNEYIKWLQGFLDLSDKKIDTDVARSLLPTFTRLHMLALDLSYFSEYIEWKKGIRIGKGSQATICQCVILSTNTPKAVRTIQIASHDLEVDAAKEVYYACFFRGVSNVMQLDGFRIAFDNDRKIKKIRCFYPLMTGDGNHYLRREDNFSLNQKLCAIIDVGTAISQLHELDVIHSDLSLSNILYEEHDGRFRFVVSDFGHCISIGLIQDSAVEASSSSSKAISEKKADLNYFTRIVVCILKHVQSFSKNDPRPECCPEAVWDQITKPWDMKKKSSINEILDAIKNWKQSLERTTL